MKMDDLIRAYAEKYETDPDVPTDLLIAIAKAESNMDKYAYSSAQAMGIFQLTPIALLDLSKRFGMDIAPFDIESATLGAKAYLSWLRRAFSEFYDWSLVLAAWNWGYGNTLKWIAGEQELPEETSDFIDRVMRYYDTSKRG
jgi:soluble lytic murein transglycosylase-like protein